MVTLSGTVNTLEDKKKVEDSVRKIDGVRQINNQITVTGAKTAWNSEYADNANKVRENEQKYPNDFAATDADRQLNSRIRDKLSNGWFTTGYDTIVLKTTNGVVVVTGTVGSFR